MFQRHEQKTPFFNRQQAQLAWGNISGKGGYLYHIASTNSLTFQLSRLHYHLGMVWS